MAVPEKVQEKALDLEQLFADSLPLSFYICCLLLMDENVALEVCADAYRKISHTPEKIPEESSFLPWMKNVAAVACSSYLRKQDAGAFLKNPPAPDVEKLTVYHNRNLNASATAKYVENCIIRMPLPQRFAAICYYYNGMTVNQISTIMAVPVIRAKELIRMAATTLAGLTKEFNDKRVTTTKIDVSALLDVSASAQPLPPINLKETLSGIGNTIASEKTEETTKKKGSGVKKAIITAVCILLVAAIGVYVANTLWGIPFKNFIATESDASGSVMGVASDTNEIASLTEEAESQLAAVSSETEKEEPPAPEILYNTTHETFYDASGEKVRECVYSYKDGKLIRTQTATKMFTEDLTYNWNKNGTKRTTTDGEGKVCEEAWYDTKGNPTKLKYGDKPEETVKYKWSYKYDDSGRVTSATFKGTNSGKYDYSYDESGHVIKLVFLQDGDKYITDYTYDESGMVLSEVETDFDGTKIETFYTYDYEGLTFTAAVSDGTKIEGKIAKTNP